MSQFTNDDIERTANETFPGLKFYYRDVNLSRKILKVYKVYMILKEPGFTDTSNKGGGLITKHRFLIASSMAVNIEKYERGTNWGLCVIQRDSFFKVMDIYKSRKKTQITLLHIPKSSIEVFTQCRMSIEDNIIQTARRSFVAYLNDEPVPELTTEEWRKRVEAPIGIDEYGNLINYI